MRRGRLAIALLACALVVPALVGAARVDSNRRSVTTETARAPLPVPSSSTTAPTNAPSTTAAPATTAAPTTAPPTTAPPAPAPVSPTTTGVPAPAGTGGSGRILLVWTSGGLAPGFSTMVRSLPEVRSFTLVLGDLVKLAGATRPDGTTIQAAPAGWAYPIDAFAVDPASYASFQPAPDAERLAGLRPGQVVLTQTSAALRTVGVGDTLHFEKGAATVAAIVPDTSAGGAEAVFHAEDAARIGIDDERFILLTDTDREAVAREIRRRNPGDRPLALRSSAETTWLRHGDRVDPQILVKARFGEFAFRDAGGRDITIDPNWIQANIVKTTVPLLGEITCHRAIIDAVRGAMREVEEKGKGGTIDPSKYAGCQYSRRIAPGQGISRHSWGLALDINVGSNPRGDYATQDRVLVDAMTSRGFLWGGTWEYPDPAHYEMRATT